MASPKFNQNGRKGTREANGRGSLYQRHSDGLWVGSLMVGNKMTTNKAGQPGRNPDIRKVYAKTQAEAHRKLDDLRRQARAGVLVEPHRLTVEDYLRRWLRHSVTPSVRCATLTQYTALIECYVLPFLGKRKLAELRPPQLQELYASLLADGKRQERRYARSGRGLAAKSVRSLHNVLHRALDQAVKWGLVPRNVADAVDPPAVPRQEMQALSADEAQRLLRTAKGHRLEALWTLALATGAREGELLALKWDDVDWPAQTVTIQRTLTQDAQGRWQFTEPKTRRSRRTLRLSGTALQALQSHLLRQAAEKAHLGADCTDLGLIFSTSLGTPLHRRNVLRDFKLVLQKAGLPETIHVHDLRHTAATHMLANGVPVPDTSAVLGHAQASITLDVHGHALPAGAANATAKLEQALWGPAPGAN